MENTFSTKKYFQQTLGKGTNFFDDIPASNFSKNVPSNEDIFSEGPETMTSQSAFDNDSTTITEHIGITENNCQFSNDRGDSRETHKLVQNSEEPVVCRIFSSLQNEPKKTQEGNHPGSSFFDMLGSAMISQDLSSSFIMGDKGLNFMLCENNGSILGK